MRKLYRGALIRIATQNLLSFALCGKGRKRMVWRAAAFGPARLLTPGGSALDVAMIVFKAKG